MTPQSKLVLAPGVYAATVGLDLVLLDIRRDAYFCLADVAPTLTGDLAAGDLAGLAVEIGDELLSAGLAQTSVSPVRAPQVFQTPRRDLIGAEPVQLGLRQRLDFAAASSGLAWSYWRRPFQQVLARAAFRKLKLPSCEAVEAETLASRALAFHVLMPWAPVHGACLMQAALLLDYLAQEGVSADWVFGVRTWPFSAHCWVQAGDLVLNDTVERVALYAPILKV